jgi:hypothetical protein
MDTQNTTQESYRLPTLQSLQHALKLAVTEDRPILMDYWMASIGPDASKPFIGVRETKEKLLVKNEEEYTSPISKIFKSGTEYIIMTENSIYLIDSGIANKRIG